MISSSSSLFLLLFLLWSLLLSFSSSSFGPFFFFFFFGPFFLFLLPLVAFFELLFEQYEYKECVFVVRLLSLVVFFLVDHIMNCFCTNSGITIQNLNDFFVDIFTGLIAPNEICMSPSIIGNNVIKQKGDTKSVDDISRIFEFSDPIVL